MNLICKLFLLWSVVIGSSSFSKAYADSIADFDEMNGYRDQLENAGADLRSCDIEVSEVQAPTGGQVNFAVNSAEAGAVVYVKANCAVLGSSAVAATAARGQSGGPFGWIKRLFNRDRSFDGRVERKTRKFRHQRSSRRTGCPSYN